MVICSLQAHHDAFVKFIMVVTFNHPNDTMPCDTLQVARSSESNIHRDVAAYGNMLHLQLIITQMKQQL